MRVYTIYYNTRYNCQFMNGSSTVFSSWSDEASSQMEAFRGLKAFVLCNAGPDAIQIEVESIRVKYPDGSVFKIADLTVIPLG